jgi:hypothetical protein
MHIEFLVRKSVGKCAYLEQREVNSWITLRWILGIKYVRMEGGSKWIKIMSNGESWYWHCWITELLCYRISKLV